MTALRALASIALVATAASSASAQPPSPPPAPPGVVVPALPIVDARALGGVRADAAALLARGGEGGSLRMAIAAAPLGGRAAEGRTPMVLVVELDGASLATGHPGGRLGVELAIYALDRTGRLRVSRSDGVAVDLGADDGFERAGLRALARLELEPGPTTIRAFARVRQTGAFGLRELAITVPSAAAPLEPRSAAAEVGARSWIDAFLPGLARADLGALERAGGLPAGGGGELDPARAVAGDELLARVGSGSRRDREVDALVADYRRAYGRLAEGARSDAVSALAALEQRTLAADVGQGMGRLSRADGRLLAALSAASPSTHLPLALLYQELFRAHLAAGHHGLARRAASVAEELLLRAGGASGTADERRLAASGFDGLAADYLEIRSPIRAAALLERAAELDPSRPARWLALATVRERSHRLSDARAAVERALQLEPRHREARLRRARLDRLDEHGRRAAELLDGLLAEPELDWVAVVAAQERARQLIDAGRLPAAVALLERETARFPDEPALATVLAWARFRGGARVLSLETASVAERADRAQRLSPRRRYAEPPLSALIGARNEVESAALLRLEALGRALAAVDGRRG